MANYYTRTVVTTPVLLTDELVKIFQARGGEVDMINDQKETILDGIVHERMPLNEYTVVFENGWTEPCEDVDEFLIEYAHWDEKDAEAATPEFRELVVASEEDILHEALKLNPKLDHIEQQSSWSCSKMRIDGFGGSGLIVNRKGYLYLTTSHFEIDEDGVIEPSGGFTFWEPEVADVSA